MATPTLDCACRVQISAVGIVTSLKPCVPLESTTVVAKNRVVLEARRSWRISQSETFLGECIRSCITCTQTIILHVRFRLSCVAHSRKRLQGTTARRMQYRQGWLLPASHSSLRRPAKAPYLRQAETDLFHAWKRLVWSPPGINQSPPGVHSMSERRTQNAA